MDKQKAAQRGNAPQASGYSEAGASTVRRAMAGFIPNSKSPIDDINFNNATLRQRSRMLYMAAPVATAAINTNRTKIVGMGLTLKATVDRDVLGISPDAAKQWQRTTEAEFRLWAGRKQNCDAIGMNNFAGLQQLALKAWLMSGDVFPVVKRYKATSLNPYSLRIQLVEADRISTPMECCTVPALTEGIIPDGKPGAGNRIHDGVEVDGNGMIVAYHIRSTYPGQLAAEQTVWTRVLAYGAETGLPNILHVTDTERCDQYRGVPYLAQVIEPLLQLRRYTESELMAALIQSFFTAWIETNTNPAEIPINEVGGGEVVGVPGANPSDAEEVSHDENEYEMGPGTVTHLAEGESVHFGQPNIPNAGFEAFVKTLCRLIGAALELPYDVLIKEFNSSYSASRGALLEAWEAFKMRRAWFVDDFCQPIYEIWLAEAVALGRIKAPGFFTDPRIREAWCGAQWIGPVQGQLDPVKEVKAAVTMVDNGFKTREQVTREQGGGDWEANLEQLALENQKMAEAGLTPTASNLPDNDPDEGGQNNA